MEDVLTHRGQTQSRVSVPSPKNKPTLQAFFGLVNYYQQNIPNIHKLRAPLNDLPNKEVKWNWFVKHQNAFEDKENTDF